MNWATQRRLAVLLIIGACIAAFLAIMSITVFYEAPSCSDSLQNQGEDGIDCGGPCAYLCTEQVRPPTVLFTKTLLGATGRVDVIASIENVNATAAAKNVQYKISIYGDHQAFIQDVTGTVDLPPSGTVPVFVLGIPSGNQKVVRAFLTIDSAAPKWFTMEVDPRVKPVVANTKVVGTIDAPRIDAFLTNPSAEDIADVKTIVLVRDDKGEVITASQTVVPVVPAQGQATATFTWNSAFSSAPAAIEVLPVIPLP